MIGMCMCAWLLLLSVSGQEDIESLTRLLLERAANLPPGTPPLAITPIYAALPPEQQLKAFQPAPAGARKVGRECAFPRRDCHVCIKVPLKALQLAPAGAGKVGAPVGRKCEFLH